MDQDAWAKGLDYSQVPLDISLQVYESVRNAIIYYAGVHYERSGHLEFVHSVDGVGRRSRSYGILRPSSN